MSGIVQVQRDPGGGFGGPTEGTYPPVCDQNAHVAPAASGRHTRFVRWPWLVALVIASASADARPTPSRRPPPEKGNFWSDIIEPNGTQVNSLLEKANRALKILDDVSTGDTDWAVEQRTRYVRDAYHLMAYARKLAPENVQVLALLGRTADDLGKTREAIDALEACVRVTGPDKASPEVTGRLGAIYLRLDNYDAAIRWLRQAQGPITAQSAPALVHLANALAARGETVAAIDALTNAIPTTVTFYAEEPVTLVTFSLAVLYDRDEQRSAAFDVLDHLQATHQTQYASKVQTQLAKMRFAPAADQHYYQAFLYESLGRYVEARAEWALYAASGESPWRARALDHMAAIDAQRRTGKPVRPDPSAPAPIRRRLPRP